MKPILAKRGINRDTELVEYFSKDETISQPDPGKRLYQQQQRGPWCQTISINNFVGGEIVTPKVLHDLIQNLIGSLPSKGMFYSIFVRLHVLRTIRQEISAKKAEIVKKRHVDLSLDEKRFLNSANVLEDVLECRFCEITQHNSYQLKKLLTAADKSATDRLLITFSLPETGAHVIAVRRNSQGKGKLWSVLDSDENAYPEMWDNVTNPKNDTFSDTLEGIIAKCWRYGGLIIAAPSMLFETEQNIACFSLKMESNNRFTWEGPNDKQNFSWYGLLSMHSHLYIDEFMKLNQSKLLSYQFTPTWPGVNFFNDMIFIANACSSTKVLNSFYKNLPISAQYSPIKLYRNRFMFYLSTPSYWFRIKGEQAVKQTVKQLWTGGVFFCTIVICALLYGTAPRNERPSF